MLIIEKIPKPCSNSLYWICSIMLFWVSTAAIAFDDDLMGEGVLGVQKTTEKARPQPITDVPFYRIGPGDNLNVFVWRNPDLTQTVPVRPDGRISLPLVEDLTVAGKTPTEIAREIEKVLSVYVKDPIVTVIVTSFVGPYDQQVRVLGEAGKPQVMPYRAKMTLLDVMIAVGGLTEFAAGNRSIIIRTEDGVQKQFKVRLEDLIKDGDITANEDLLPGDVLIIPEAWF